MGQCIECGAPTAYGSNRCSTHAPKGSESERFAEESGLGSSPAPSPSRSAASHVEAAPLAMRSRSRSPTGVFIAIVMIVAIAWIVWMLLI